MCSWNRANPAPCIFISSPLAIKNSIWLRNFLLTNFLVNVPTVNPHSCRSDVKTIQIFETDSDCCQKNILRCLCMLFLDLHLLGLSQTYRKRHPIIIILDFPRGEFSISFNKAHYDPRQVTF